MPRGCCRERKLEATPPAAGTPLLDEGRPLLDAATGEEVARISSAGLDLREMTAYARRPAGRRSGA